MFVVFAVLLVFAIGNSGLINIRFLSYERTAPLVLVLFVFLVLGVIVGLIALTGPLYRQRRQIQQLKRDIKLQEQIRPRATPPDGSRSDCDDAARLVDRTSKKQFSRAHGISVLVVAWIPAVLWPRLARGADRLKISTHRVPYATDVLFQGTQLLIE